VTKPFAWSYSSLTAFETCPWRWKLTKRTKEVVEPQTEATLAGNRVHKGFEDAIKNHVPLPTGYTHFQPLIDRLRITRGVVETERKVALTPQFTETTYFGKDVWLRAQFDVRITSPDKTVILDWKTGKRKLDADQLRLFAGIEFKLRPSIQTVQTGYAWLRDKKIDKEVFHRDQAAPIWQEFSIRVARIEHAIASDNFPKKPSGLCREYCPVGRRLCEHCGG